MSTNAEMLALKDRAHADLKTKDFLDSSKLGQLNDAFATGGFQGWLQKLLDFAKSHPQLLQWLLSIFGQYLPTPPAGAKAHKEEAEEGEHEKHKTHGHETHKGTHK